MTVNILLPVYNEERRIAHGVEGTVEFLTSIGFDDYRITVVDNASTDRTPELAEGLCEKYPGVHYLRLSEKGVGVAFKNGVMNNTCDIVGYMDIDLSTDIKHLGEAISLLTERDLLMVNASRWSKQSDTYGRKWYRNLSSYGLTFLMKLFLKMKASDAICGFKFFKKDFVEELIAESGDEAGWFFIIELLLRAERKQPDKIYELPVRWKDDYDSKVDFFKVVKNYLHNIFRLRREFKKEGIL